MPTRPVLNPWFRGHFKCTPFLNPDQIAYLTAFSRSRRMTWNGDTLADVDDPLREAVDISGPGKYGEFYVGHAYDAFIPTVGDLTYFNTPPGQATDFDVGYGPGDERAQPGLWCQWVPTPDGEAIVWNQGEKFRNFVEWIEYLIRWFVSRWNVTLNGRVTWQADGAYDIGNINIRDNQVFATDGRSIAETAINEAFPKEEQ